MFNNVQIWVGGMWRRLTGQTDRGGAELGRRGMLRTWQQAEGSKTG